MFTLSYIPRQTLSIQIKNLKSSFEIRLCIFCLFLLNMLTSLISLTVTHTPESHKELNNSLCVSAYTLCSLRTTKWLMCENGMSPGVPLRSKSKLEPRLQTIPWYLLGLYFKITDKHTVL